MGMTPYQFFDAFVLGNYDDCLRCPGCVRRAFNAAVSASQLADHYWKYWEKNDKSKLKGFKTFGEFIEDLSTNTDCCFRDIRSIANAYKHLYTSTYPNKAVHSSISSTGAIESIHLPNEDAEVKGLEENWPEDSTSKNNESQVIYTRKDGQQLKFLPTLKTVINYWTKKVHS